LKWGVCSPSGEDVKAEIVLSYLDKGGGGGITFLSSKEKKQLGRLLVGQWKKRGALGLKGVGGGAV